MPPTYISWGCDACNSDLPHLLYSSTPEEALYQCVLCWQSVSIIPFYFGMLHSESIQHEDLLHDVHYLLEVLQQEEGQLLRLVNGERPFDEGSNALAHWVLRISLLERTQYEALLQQRLHQTRERKRRLTTLLNTTDASSSSVPS